MLKKTLLAGAIGSLVFLSACGGSSRSDSTSPTPQGGDGRVTTQDVSGPLDPVQDQLSGGVLCANQVVTYDVLDIADSVLAQLQEAASGGGAQPDPAALAASLQSLVVDLTGLLGSLGGVGDNCLTSSLTLDQISAGGNPLAGTPLEPLGAALAPVLAQIAGALDAADGSGEDLQLTTVSTLVSQLNTALHSGLSQIPAEARGAPVVGGILTTLVVWSLSRRGGRTDPAGLEPHFAADGLVRLPHPSVEGAETLGQALQALGVPNRTKALVALSGIRRSEGALTGQTLARLAIALSLGCLAAALVSVSVREAASVASTARPIAPPT